MSSTSLDGVNSVARTVFVVTRPIPTKPWLGALIPHVFTSLTSLLIFLWRVAASSQIGTSI
jgi:hypothetical protein